MWECGLTSPCQQVIVPAEVCSSRQYRQWQEKGTHSRKLHNHYKALSDCLTNTWHHMTPHDNNCPWQEEIVLSFFARFKHHIHNKMPADIHSQSLICLDSIFSIFCERQGKRYKWCNRYSMSSVLILCKKVLIVYLTYVKIHKWCTFCVYESEFIFLILVVCIKILFLKPAIHSV